MTRFSSLLAAFLLSATVASAAPVPLPAGTRWFVFAPHANRFAQDATSLLTSASSLAPALAPSRMNDVTARSYGLGLLSLDALTSSGVDPTEPWMLFERGGAVYLSVTVRDRAKLTATLDQWGSARLLKVREETKLDRPKGAVMVTFGRARGSRAAAGYLIAGDRAVILVSPAERNAALPAAYDAIEGAAPVEPSVDGTLVLWMGNETALRDGWVALTARSDGIDVTGAARKLDAGFVDRDAGHAEWIRALTSSPNGLSGDLPLWIRVMAGSKTGAQVIGGLGRLFAEHVAGPGTRPWMDNLKSLSAGPLEIVATSVDVKAVQSGGGGGVQQDILRLMHPSLLFVDRPAATTTANFKLAKAALCDAKPVGDEAVRATCSEPGLTVGQTTKALFVGWTGSLAKPALPALSGGPTLSCAKGTPIAAARFNPAVVGRGLGEVSFLDAMGSESLAGMLAIGSEYGRLLQASLPAIGLACAEPSGRVTLQGRWRFRAP